MTIMMMMDEDEDNDKSNTATPANDCHHPRHRNYHRSILCIPSCALMTIIAASLGLQVMPHVPFDTSQGDDDDDG